LELSVDGAGVGVALEAGAVETESCSLLHAGKRKMLGARPIATHTTSGKTERDIVRPRFDRDVPVR
jgi:hypothetical protein